MGLGGTVMIVQPPTRHTAIELPDLAAQRQRLPSLGDTTQPGKITPLLDGSLSQHLAQLSLSLRRLTREGFVPYAHKLHVGVPEGELNPRSIRYLSSDGNAVGYRNFFQPLDKPAARWSGWRFCLPDRHDIVVQKKIVPLK